jgi:hypothetical protein
MCNLLAFQFPDASRPGDLSFKDTSLRIRREEQSKHTLYYQGTHPKMYFYNKEHEEENSQFTNRHKPNTSVLGINKRGNLQIRQQ